jgi:hypothetical protein
VEGRSAQGDEAEVAGRALSLSQLTGQIHTNNNPNEPDLRPSNATKAGIDIDLVFAGELCCSYDGGSLYFGSPAQVRVNVTMTATTAFSYWCTSQEPPIKVGMPIKIEASIVLGFSNSTMPESPA